MIRQIIQSIKLFIHKDEKFYGLSFSQLGFVPSDKNIYKLALLHKSATEFAADGTALNYERLEFLGDAVLGAVVAEILYRFFPDKDEGFLTRVRSKLVSRESLNDLAIQIGLDKAVIAKSDISHNKHVYGDVFEALVGAILLDQGFVTTKRFIERFILPNFFDIEKVVSVDSNYKSRLIEWGQKNKVEVHFETSEYYHSRTLRFRCVVSVASEERGCGEGSSKKEAEQHAAKKVISQLVSEAEGQIEI